MICWNDSFFFLLGKTRSWSLEHDRRTPRRRSSKWGVFNECKQARKKRGKKKAILYEYCAMSIKKDEILNLPGFANFERYLYLRRGNELHSRVWFRTPFLTELLNMVWRSGGGGGGGAEEDVWPRNAGPHRDGVEICERRYEHVIANFRRSDDEWRSMRVMLLDVFLISKHDDV